MVIFVQSFMFIDRSDFKIQRFEIWVTRPIFFTSYDLHKNQKFLIHVEYHLDNIYLKIICRIFITFMPLCTQTSSLYQLTLSLNLRKCLQKVCHLAHPVAASRQTLVICIKLSNSLSSITFCKMSSFLQLFLQLFYFICYTILNAFYF